MTSNVLNLLICFNHFELEKVLDHTFAILNPKMNLLIFRSHTSQVFSFNLKSDLHQT